ncbi:MAG TPA: flagellar protein FlgN [Rhodocyclaceae bacterium]
MESLIDLVSRECRLLTEFVALLGDEEQALVAGDTEALAKVTPRKTEIVSRLNQIADLRNRNMRASGLPADTAGLESWRQRDSSSASAADQLITLAGQARERNRVNGQLIALHLQKTQEALAALTGGDARRQTYGRDGQTEPAKTGYRLIDSA